jgi:hypothetical protein
MAKIRKWRKPMIMWRKSKKMAIISEENTAENNGNENGHQCNENELKMKMKSNGNQLNESG